MAKAETLVVYAAATIQGIVLVTIPAASNIFTNPQQYGLSSTRYGTLFVPQVIAAIATSLLGTWLSRRFGTKPVYLAGLTCGLISMVLLLLSAVVMSRQSLAYGLLLLANASLGAGFGLTVPALNSLTAAFHPGAVDSSVLVVNALLGVGTALAPAFVAVFVGLGFWWGLPVLSSILLVALILASLPLPLRTGARIGAREPGVQTASLASVAARFWPYAALATVYGICEAVNGNWAQLDMTRSLGASVTMASLALTAFWAMVTVGRVLFAVVQKRFPARWIYHILPFLLAGVFLIISALPSGRASLGVLAFGLAGLCCSALLPLTISFGHAELTAFSASVAGGVIAFYQLGYGIAAFGVGPLVDAGLPLSTVYALASVVAVIMGVLSFTVARRPR